MNAETLANDLALASTIPSTNAQRQHAIIRFVSWGSSIQALTVWSSSDPELSNLPYLRGRASRIPADTLFDFEVVDFDAKYGRNISFVTTRTRRGKLPWNTLRPVIDAWTSAIYAARFDPREFMVLHATRFYFAADSRCATTQSPPEGTVAGHLVSIAALIIRLVDAEASMRDELTAKVTEHVEAIADSLGLSPKRTAERKL
jgi:hypothetical protein